MLQLPFSDISLWPNNWSFRRIMNWIYRSNYPDILPEKLVLFRNMFWRLILMYYIYNELTTCYSIFDVQKFTLLHIITRGNPCFTWEFGDTEIDIGVLDRGTKSKCSGPAVSRGKRQVYVCLMYSVCLALPPQGRQTTGTSLASVC